MDHRGADAGIHARRSAVLDRWVQLGVAGEKVISLSFPETPDEKRPEHPLLGRITAYLEGEEVSFGDVDVGLTVPTDRRNVLESVRQVPHGQNATVAQIARMVPGMDHEDDRDLATVRDALADNPVPLLIPDHRVRDGPSAPPPAVQQTLRAIEGL
jgi:methylated-DNA-[protein]-cysteine S-methyltransferase